MDVLSILTDPKFWIGILFIALFALYRYGTSTFHIFSENGIPGPRPLPFIGNLWGVWNMNMWEEDLKKLKKYGKIVGFFEGKRPVLLVMEPEIVKGILVKDFEHFVNHTSLDGPELSVFRKMVFVLHDQEWKDVRSSITPAFSSGKIKKMTTTIKEHVDRKALRLKEEARDGCTLDAMRMFSEITVGVIAECAFGIKIDNLGSEDSEFLKHATNLLGSKEDLAALTSYSTVLPFLFPSMVGQYIGNNNSYKFFMDAIEDVMNRRSQMKDKFNDFLSLFDQLLSEVTMEVDGKQVKRWTGGNLREIISAQGLEFMIDGYAGTAMGMSNLVYRLAMHPDIQQRVYDEVMEKLEKFGEVSHEMIHEATYLDQFISEVFRIHLITPRIDRECCKDITYGGITIKKGMAVEIPVYAMHYSEEYFPDPHTFNPDRWSPENKSSILPYTYLPFGGGPRGCIGSRFAMEQMKIAMCTLISQFEFYPAEETMRELKFMPGYMLILAPLNTTIGIRVRQN